MNNYIAPGVHVEETGARSRKIDGVLTSTCAFVGPTTKGPVGVASGPLTSFADYERIYGGVKDLPFATDKKALHRRNYLAHAARAFFDNGGMRLHVVRVVAGFRTGKGVVLPDANEYAAAFASLEGLGDISIVAAPGYSALSDLNRGAVYRAIQTAMLAHVADPLRYRMAVLDSPPGATPTEMQALPGLIDSTRAALYYPWVITANPLAGPKSRQPAEIALAPSGFVCGTYARSDIERGVHHSPANEEVLGALRFERELNTSEHELLNPVGVNCLRAFTGRGLRVWGGRTTSRDPEWKYVNVRRYFNYLGASIDCGTQWTVFEPNGENLWATMRQTVSDFLTTEWQNGGLIGSQPPEAYFVRCDRTTMTQDDLDNGRLVCLIGVALMKPAEFMILRIGQRTSDLSP